MPWNFWHMCDSVKSEIPGDQIKDGREVKLQLTATAPCQCGRSERWISENRVMYQICEERAAVLLPNQLQSVTLFKGQKQTTLCKKNKKTFTFQQYLQTWEITFLVPKIIVSVRAFFVIKPQFIEQNVHLRLESI